ncbi:phosphatase PAP2 family protein [Frigoribacterium sp. CFBP 13707]|jgi:membrane-associated phospholipid phosphatase|uniref:phosphatase PAP2 family protein n=1 Tax=Frigoribacterium sp. CFBP 13707 TaxID=2775313 RepID=UPI001786031A|nr:phosphatase PAP2 family protein [Frigoribacterium sp. CFBP 13707]MBD8727194.1 phosphatase PAP2 family protein [Frigoribacterium sp. CFBP 13707]
MTTDPLSPKPPTPAEERVARRVQRRWWVVSALGAIGVVLLLGVVITARAGSLGIDEEFMGELVEHRSPFWQAPALVFNVIGAGVIGVFVVPLGVAAVLLLRRRPWAALYWIASCALSAGVVQVIKHTFGRARPEEILVVSDYGSFPSGHTANAATLAVVLGVILRRAWVWIAGVVYTVAMLLSRTYLGAHWLTDTVGGLLIGAGVAVVLWAPVAHRLLAEQERVRGLGWAWQHRDERAAVTS